MCMPNVLHKDHSRHDVQIKPPFVYASPFALEKSCVAPLVMQIPGDHEVHLLIASDAQHQSFAPHPKALRVEHIAI